MFSKIAAGVTFSTTTFLARANPLQHQQSYGLGAIPEDTANLLVPNPTFIASFGASAAPHTCTLSIERVNKGPYDYQKIIGTGVQFIDDQFNPPTTDLLTWADFPRTDGSGLASTASKVAGFYRPTDKDPSATLFGSGISPNHIFQGLVGDCYYVAVLSSIATHPDRINKLFLTQ